ncbi:hypothetical protein BC835DRAFT_301064 [Cytidiella melzeri]|nr:hypothetical protein BC835DRAFT_301064 [Cytidiella melzeri]
MLRRQHTTSTASSTSSTCGSAICHSHDPPLVVPSYPPRSSGQSIGTSEFPPQRRLFSPFDSSSSAKLVGTSLNPRAREVTYGVRARAPAPRSAGMSLGSRPLRSVDKSSLAVIAGDGQSTRKSHTRYYPPAAPSKSVSSLKSNSSLFSLQNGQSTDITSICSSIQGSEGGSCPQERVSQEHRTVGGKLLQTQFGYGLPTRKKRREASVPDGSHSF